MTHFDPDDLVEMESGSGVVVFLTALPLNASISLGRFATIMQSDVYAILKKLVRFLNHKIHKFVRSTEVSESLLHERNSQKFIYERTH